jgi:glutathione S-transferase
MTQPKIVLHQWEISPFCGKIRKVLGYKGLAYEVVEYAGLRALEVKRLSDTGKLPVLDIDGERFRDSSVIARELERRFPTPPLWPQAARARHLSHLLEDWADESLYWIESWARFCDPAARDRAATLLSAGRPAFERNLVKIAMGRYGKAASVQGIGRYPEAHVTAELRAHLDALDGLLEGATWLTGDAPSIADIAVAAQLDEFRRTSRFKADIDARPRLQEWLERCRFEPSPRTQEASAKPDARA